jgi:hypothetical protein
LSSGLTANRRSRLFREKKDQRSVGIFAGCLRLDFIDVLLKNTLWARQPQGRESDIPLMIWITGIIHLTWLGMFLKLISKPAFAVGSLLRWAGGLSRCRNGLQLIPSCSSYCRDRRE